MNLLSEFVHERYVQCNGYRRSGERFNFPDRLDQIGVKKLVPSAFENPDLIYVAILGHIERNHYSACPAHPLGTARVREVLLDNFLYVGKVFRPVLV